MRLIQRNVNDATSDAMDEAADDLLLRSQLLCKIDEGDLLASGTVAYRNRKDTYLRIVYYDTPYAVRQHECTEMGLGPKTKAKPSSPLGDGKPGRKWLTRPFRRHRKRYIEEIGDAISDAIRGTLR